ncbi:carbohydrate kinase family protein [Methylophaga sulfidovorans]|uniref:Fructokinase n=1 Tax=Methylophaga sulfidovorans TaxID=45496 RepID=A0A1I3VRZ5_9GAMM|nr:carbohydrate kinase [Methylophaga sulfidovorans]SFJ97693.1 fructokinase [Methylophaga sulfidovorans]
MKSSTKLTIFGEALFDCFPTGENVLGGAPFNVAWHLQALGDAPLFISRVGKDELGDIILSEMTNWGMTTKAIQQDSKHQTGRVDIRIENDEPIYTFAEDNAWDFIDLAEVPTEDISGFFYHGSLVARREIAKKTLEKLTENPSLDIFVDVNLRSPWWEKETVYHWLEQARWVKLNESELYELGFHSADLHQDMTRMHTHFHLDQLIVTRGEKGAIVRDTDGAFHQVAPPQHEQVVDTVGAGDAFTAMYIHGLLAGWKIEDTLEKAQAFASRVVKHRGAVSKDPDFYK